MNEFEKEAVQFALNSFQDLINHSERGIKYWDDEITQLELKMEKAKKEKHYFVKTRKIFLDAIDETASIKR